MNAVRIAAGLLLALVLAACTSGGGGVSVGSPLGFTGSCHVVTAPHEAMVTFTNTTKVKLTISGLVVQGWNNGARVANVTKVFANSRHVRPGRTQSVFIKPFDKRAVTCRVTVYLA